MTTFDNSEGQDVSHHFHHFSPLQYNGFKCKNYERGDTFKWHQRRLLRYVGTCGGSHDRHNKISHLASLWCKKIHRISKQLKQALGWKALTISKERLGNHPTALSLYDRKTKFYILNERYTWLPRLSKRIIGTSMKLHHRYKNLESNILGKN